LHGVPWACSTLRLVVRVLLACSFFHVHLYSLLCCSLGGASALFTFICVHCTLRTQIS
jgi:hypothetical protein